MGRPRKPKIQLDLFADQPLPEPGTRWWLGKHLARVVEVVEAGPDAAVHAYVGGSRHVYSRAKWHARAPVLLAVNSAG